MNRKRLIVVGIISVILVSILLIQNTYSVFTTTSPDEEVNTFKTGNLDIEVIGDDKKVENILPIKEEESNKLTPYHITVKNNGTVAYRFNIALEETTSNNPINPQYIMTKVGTLETKPLSETQNNIIKEGITILPNETIEIDIRVWISNKVPNTEINKSFYAKIKVTGSATWTKNIKVDNSSLVNPKEETTQSEDLQNQIQQSDNKEKEELQQ